MERQNIIPVLLGADLNCYNVARAFHEEYGVKSYAFGRYSIGASNYTRIIKFTIVEKLEEPEVMVATLREFAEKHNGATLIAFGCTDEYASMLIHYGDQLRDKYIVPYIGAELFERLAYKANFYEDCDKHEILYPNTKIVTPDSDFEAILDEEALGFSYPIIIKPSASAVYWHYPFDGMKKVYTAASKGEAEIIIRRIYASGYPEKIILQDMIPGDDSRMRVLTAYSDQHGKVKMMCLGHVLLEEHTPKGLGNHCAIITELDRPLMEKFKAYLEDIGFVGYSNFDIKYDERDGSFRAFEINLRLGRSNNYVTSAGCNVAKYIVDDYVDNKELGDTYYCDTEVLWHSVPKGVVYQYCRDRDEVSRAKSLAKAGKAHPSLWYGYDLVLNPRRLFFLIMHGRNHYGKFKKYYGKE
ncbi:MAG: ATP-grasp domain-containing protein [Clostridiales bacterium]|nr:ATP-grasp domain-containing protein [Clostridiales bacterium]